MLTHRDASSPIRLQKQTLIPEGIFRWNSNPNDAHASFWSFPARHSIPFFQLPKKRQPVPDAIERNSTCISPIRLQKQTLIPEGIRVCLRKGWDSNPRSVISRTHDFQSCALDQLSHLCVCCVYSGECRDTIHLPPFRGIPRTALPLYHISRPFVKSFRRKKFDNDTDFRPVSLGAFGQSA